jgi:hypothetical protein
MCSSRFLGWSDCGNFDGQLGEFFTKVVTKGMTALQREQLLGGYLGNDRSVVAAEIVRQPKLELCSSQSSGGQPSF